MKIGFEYECLIIGRGDFPVRWKDIPEDKRNHILEVTRRSGFYGEEAPVDRYDCLAEIRTHPMDVGQQTGARDILYVLFDAITRAQRIFGEQGYSLAMQEREIPEALHEEIVKDLEKSQKNQTLCFGQEGVVNYSNPANRYRGGGLHMTISPVPHRLAPALVLELHRNLQHHSVKAGANGSFKSEYRKNILFRTKVLGGEQCAEYMSFGFEVVHDGTRTHLQNSFDLVRHQFHWAEALVSTLNSFKQYT